MIAQFSQDALAQRLKLESRTFLTFIDFDKFALRRRGGGGISAHIFLEIDGPI